MLFVLYFLSKEERMTVIRITTEVDLDEHIEEIKQCLEESNYIVLKPEQAEIYEQLKDYINQMGKNLMYIDDSCTKKHIVKFMKIYTT